MRPAPIAAWHALLEHRRFDELDRLLADDVVFESPVVHTPQAGRAKTTLYLRAAFDVLNNASFRYLGEWFAERSAVLEFAAEVDGITVNGVDMIWWDESERIVRFKVLVRPLKAIDLLHRKMGERLQKP
jgi:hypothetical protein